MRFTVTGRLREGQPYDVVVSDAEEPVGGWGMVTGTASALALLHSLVGPQVAASPTGPFYELHPRDPKSILAALIQHTDVLATAGEVPDISDGLSPGETA